ncbi:hypothetical protein TVAG_221610 [Trichomonas vaginalis G3]|uniref:DUF3447 domain-containing protein n=1 Tax=Trichomonas vaginalis (strain ATCC PRA-98 / G3) TaxID=412133 RepID=A2E3B7_TRIV3|nr:spectrin binding [Trichomonas vaginalis G3]EAY12808.1 hypothetical protein TVAG_221610 [Trichomonas vaginalis G3]KAI5488539.1 spectrin binding [Trichomonas vaginalis G3]|eukprot:XP_001325031.1 hypothetical protein [Trichomonas vaginalis G3]
MPMCKEYSETILSLYKLNTFDDEVIDKICNDITKNLIQTKYFTPIQIISKICKICIYNNRFIKSYWKIFKQIFDKFHPKPKNDIGYIYDYFIHCESGIHFNEEDQKYFEQNRPSYDIPYEYSIYRAMMDDDKISFIQFIERNDFDVYEKRRCIFYPLRDTYDHNDYCDDYSLLELCCYHGAAKCFKLLMTKFNPNITRQCLQFSFLGGNPEIMNECLKQLAPDEKCMKYAIISHNIDFVTFLMNEYSLEINLELCRKYNNIDAFLVYLDQTNDINKCFAFSPCFCIPSLCDYLLTHGANIDAKSLDGINYNRDKYFSHAALYYALRYGNENVLELFISKGINIYEKDQHERSALHIAVIFNRLELLKILLPYFENINVKDKFSMTPLYYSVVMNDIQSTNYLICNGADINTLDKQKRTPLHIACSNTNYICVGFHSYGVVANKCDIVKLLIQHGAVLNLKDQFDRTALYYASESQDISALLISNGAI